MKRDLDELLETSGGLEETTVRLAATYRSARRRVVVRRWSVLAALVLTPPLLWVSVPRQDQTPTPVEVAHVEEKSPVTSRPATPAEIWALMNVSRQVVRNEPAEVAHPAVRQLASRRLADREDARAELTGASDAATVQELIRLTHDPATRQDAVRVLMSSPAAEARAFLDSPGARGMASIRKSLEVRSRVSKSKVE
jgi:hypothetical protein